MVHIGYLLTSDWVFDDFTLRRRNRELSRNGAPIALGARAFDVLCVLAERAGHTVTKSELFDRVWPNLVVEENNLQVHVSTLRKLLGAGSISTVSGKGYCFTRTVLELGSPPVAPKPGADDPSPVALTRSVAVLPFANLTPVNANGVRDDDYFADGIAEDIINHLTRSRWLFVVARNSSFTYRGDAVNVRQVSKELGVRYVVFGSVRRAGVKLRITAEMVDGASGDTLWSQRFDRSPDDLFAVQDDIAHAITSAIEPVYLSHEERHTQAASRQDPQAAINPNTLQRWDLLMHARWHFWRSTREHLDHASNYLRQALALNPEDPQALSLMAFTHFSRVWAGWAPDPKGEIAQSQRLAMQAVRNDAHDSFAHFTLGTAWSLMGQVDRAIGSLQTALQIYPQFAAAAGELGRMYAFSAMPDEAHEYALQAIDASPHDPHVSLWLRSRAVACFTQGEFDDALKFAKAAAAKRADWFFNHYLVAACATLAGQPLVAQSALELARAHGRYPEHALKVGHPFTNPQHLSQFTQALLDSGWQG